jgi:hypothetical protein
MTVEVSKVKRENQRLRNELDMMRSMLKTAAGKPDDLSTEGLLKRVYVLQCKLSLYERQADAQAKALDKYQMLKDEVMALAKESSHDEQLSRKLRSLVMPEESLERKFREMRVEDNTAFEFKWAKQLEEAKLFLKNKSQADITAAKEARKRVDSLQSELRQAQMRAESAESKLSELKESYSSLQSGFNVEKCIQFLQECERVFIEE